MNFTFENIIMFISIFLTGLSAGLCFTWSNAVTPGIGNLPDLGFLQSFQEINRSIINPVFIIVFFGPFFLNLISLYLLSNQINELFLTLMITTALYTIGVLFVTIFGNIPLNEMLDKVDLTNASTNELASLRNRFEAEWNRLHMFRTISSSISFLILIIIQLLKNNS